MTHRMSRFSLFLVLGGLVVACDDSSPTRPSTTPAPPAVPAPVPSTPPPPPVENLPPVPDFNVTPFPATGPAPLEVNFNLCPTADPDHDLIVFFFDFGDGETAQGPPCRQQHTYHPGRYTANMCVWDSRPEHSLECVAFPVDAR